MAIPIFNIIAVISWFSISGSGFYENCGNTPKDFTETLEVCSSAGPVLSITAVPISIILFIIFCVIYSKRSQTGHAFHLRELN